MSHTFKVGDRVTITPAAVTRVGQSGVITQLYKDNAVVRFDDGEELGFLIDDGELEAA